VASRLQTCISQPEIWTSNL